MQMTNPVDYLQKFCQSKGWLPPNYIVESVHGPSHEQIFVVSCVINEYKEKACGPTKNIAKRNAANEMCAVFRPHDTCGKYGT